MKRSDQRREAVFLLYQSELRQTDLSELLEGAKPFTRALAEGVAGMRTALDMEIDDHAHNWDVERLGSLERAILRVALYELHHRDDVPPHVSVSEAVHLAAEYCGSEAPRFVNGILAAIAGPEALRRPAGAGGGA